MAEGDFQPPGVGGEDAGEGHACDVDMASPVSHCNDGSLHSMDTSPISADAGCVGCSADDDQEAAAIASQCDSDGPGALRAGSVLRPVLDDGPPTSLDDLLMRSVWQSSRAPQGGSGSRLPPAPCSQSEPASSAVEQHQAPQLVAADPDADGPARVFQAPAPAPAAAAVHIGEDPQGVITMSHVQCVHVCFRASTFASMVFSSHIVSIPCC